MLLNSSRNSLKSENASPLLNGNQRSSRRLEVVFKQSTKVTAITTKLEWKIDQVCFYYLILNIKFLV